MAKIEFIELTAKKELLSSQIIQQNNPNLN